MTACCVWKVGKAGLWLASPPVEAGRPATFSEMAPWQPLVTWKHAVSRDDDPSLWVSKSRRSQWIWAGGLEARLGLPSRWGPRRAWPEHAACG